MGAFSFQLTGDKQLDAFFRTFPMKVQKKVVRKPLRDGAKIINDAAKTIAPVQSGQLRRALKVRAAKRSRRNKNVVTVRPQIGEGDFKGDTFYGAFVEYGTKKMAGRHYMEQAFKTKSEPAKNVVLAGIKQGIESEARLGSH